MFFRRRIRRSAGTVLSCLAGGFFVFALPASTNYGLRDFGFGSGGQDAMISDNYSMEGLTGQTDAASLSGSEYALGGGLSFVQQAHVPPAPAFDNPDDQYDRLRLILDAGDNPTDSRFAVAISDDDWVTTRYVQSDMTVGSVLGSEDYRQYASWGGGSGGYVIGLSPDTAFKVRVKAMQGNFTETGYGPEAASATSTPKLSFDIDVSSSDTETAPPFSVPFGSLVAGTVVDSPVRVWVDFSTNGNSGGKVFVSGENGGLSSTSVGSTITSSTGDLSALSSGYGVQGSSVTQVSGGPLSIVAPYDGSLQTVGIIDMSIREILTSGNPVVNGRASFSLKAKSSSVTPAAGDYEDVLTVVATGNF